MTETEIIEKYKQYIVFKGSEAYFKLKTSLLFVKECSSNNLCIIGIEGFKLINNSLEPQSDMIADFSSIQSTSWEEHKKICNEAAGELLFRFCNKYKFSDDILVNFVTLNKKDFDEIKK